MTRSVLLLRGATGVSAAGLQLSVDGSSITGFAPDATLGNLPARALPGAFNAAVRGSHVLKVEAAGAFAPVAPPAGSSGAIDPERLLDALVYLEYTVTA